MLARSAPNVVLPTLLFVASSLAATAALAQDAGLEYQLPRRSLMLPFEKQTPITFVTSKNPAEWSKLPGFWNPTTESVIDPHTGLKTQRAAVKIKVPLGLTQPPPVPVENPMTMQRWELGRRLYFDSVLSSDGTISCASCHEPGRGFTDQAPFSVGIGGNKGGISAPTVMNSAYNTLQFWDGRATSLEDQAQGPPQNALEMFDGKDHAWSGVVRRVRKKGDYIKRFHEAFGTDPTRDTIAQAIATYERTVLNGNSIHDRAEQAMRERVVEEESADFTIKSKDYAKALKDAFAKRDVVALAALNLDPANDAGKIAAVASGIDKGRVLFFGKARCSLCHTGENFTDSQFHNLGVGAKDGKMDSAGRYSALPTGHKNPEAFGAFKTPTLRGLTSTAPYMHDGGEKTLEAVVDFYDRGGNPNEYLSSRLRDIDAEQAYVRAQQTGEKYKGPKVFLCGPDNRPIVPLNLNLTSEEKAQLVLFMRSLEGEVDALVTAADRQPPTK